MGDATWGPMEEGMWKSEERGVPVCFNSVLKACHEIKISFPSYFLLPKNVEAFLVFFFHMHTYAFNYETGCDMFSIELYLYVFIIVSPKVKLVDTVLMAARDLRICRAVFMLYLSIFSI